MSESDRKSSAWYYQAREGSVGPFATKDEAERHFRAHQGGEERSGLLGRLASVFGAGVRETTSSSPVPHMTAPADEAPVAGWDGADPKETDVFGRPASLLGPMASDKYRRLPENRAVVVTIPPGEELEIYLASHRFGLSVSERSLHLRDENGRVHLLVRGTSTIGRRNNNDVVTDGNFAEVSRCHLVIDWNGGDQVGLTDLSTLGTFVAPERLPA